MINPPTETYLPVMPEPRLSPFSAGLLFPLLVLICAAFSIPGRPFVVGLALSFLAIVFATMGPTRAMPYFLILMLLGPDMTQSAPQVEALGLQKVGSPWQIRFGPLTPGIQQALVYFVVLFRLGSIRFLPSLKPFFVWSVTIGLVGFFVGKLINPGVGIPLDVTISDLRMILFLILASCVFYAYLRRYPDETVRLMQVLLLVLSARLGVDIILWATGMGAQKSGVVSGSVDSTKWATMIVALWGVANLLRGKHIFVSVLLMSLGMTMVFVYMSRMIYITGITSIVLMLIFCGKTRVLLLGGPILLLALVGGSFLVESVAPEASEVYLIRFERLGALVRLDFQAADPFRYGEYVNCMGEMAQDGTIITGRGFGGYYTDSIIPLGNDLTSAFPPWVEYTRHFPRVHSIFGHFVLKLGLIGLVLWLVAWWRAAKNLVQYKNAPPHLDTARIVLLASTPIIFFSGYWSSKGMVLTGIFFVLVHHLCRPMDQKFRNVVPDMPL